MHVDVFTLGDWMTNCHLVSDAASGECWIIDAGFDPGGMLDAIESRRLSPTRVILTHGHIDHIAGLHEVRRRHRDIPILIHEAERAFLTDPSLNLSIYLAQPFVGPEATGTLRHGDVLTLGEASFEVRHTPGHSPGNLCLYEADEGVAIVGDTLFAGSIGRSDFPTSDPRLLLTSIREQLLTLPDATRVLPGHGPATTIGREREGNPFL